MSEWDQTGGEAASPPPPGWDTGEPADPAWQERTLRGLAKGQRVFGRYRLERMLGQGGMGVVWQAEDGELKQPVALKFLPESVMFDPVALDDLRAETRRSLRLTHPNIVRVHDFQRESGRPLAAISMEFIDGQTLSALRMERPNRVFEAKELLPWVQQLCAALEYAHGQGMVHRDLKPANLMVDGAGKLKICDFGIACSLRDSITRATGRLPSGSGTLVYMSPQQMMGEDPSAADDLYAIGATLYELLTGRPPFFRGDVQEQVKHKVPEPMAERRASLGVMGEPIPLHWESVVSACLAKEAARRPRTVAEVGGRLEARGQRLEGAPSARHSTSVPGEVRKAETAGVSAERRERKRGSGGGVAIAAALVLASVGVGGWWLGYEAPRREIERIAEEQRAAADVQQREDARKAAEAAEAEKARLEQEARRQAADQERQAAMEAERLAKARGGLLVRTEPVGALVTVDGGEGKPGPAAFSDLKLGKHRVSVTADGCASKELEAEVGEGKVTEVGPVVLEALTGTVRIESEPAGAAVVWTDGRRLGVTPLQLSKVPAGEVSLRLELEGYEPEQVRGTVVGGLETPMSVVLRRVSLEGKRAGQEMENSIGMKLCWCPAGEFLMGSPPGEEGRDDDERQHRVVLSKGFWLGKYEVTQGEYERIIGSNPSNFKAAGSRAPVEQVSWEDAVGFCAKLTAVERAAGRLPGGWEYRLPTEAQWEYGCRAETTGTYAGDLDEMGWYDRNSGNTTHPVGQKVGNGWGLHDMHGNVWEWCLDRKGEYSAGTVTDPGGPASGSNRVDRGGSWLSGARSCRSAIRFRFEPGYRLNDLGFRVAAVPSVQ